MSEGQQQSSSTSASSSTNISTTTTASSTTTSTTTTTTSSVTSSAASSTSTASDSSGQQQEQSENTKVRQRTTRFAKGSSAVRDIIKYVGMVEKMDEFNTFSMQMPLNFVTLHKNKYSDWWQH